MTATIIKYAVRIGAGLVALLLLYLLIAYVFAIGPFKKPPSPAAKVQVQVEKAVPKVQAEAAAAVGKVEKEAKTEIAKSEKRTEARVQKIRAAAPRPAPGAARPVYRDYPDAEFYRGVCDTVVYKGDPYCRGLVRQAEDRDSRSRSGTMRRR